MMNRPMYMNKSFNEFIYFNIKNFQVTIEKYIKNIEIGQ
jgi:hypothetical protein